MKKLKHLKNLIVISSSLVLMNLAIFDTVFSFDNDIETIERTNNAEVLEHKHRGKWIIENYILKEEKLDTPIDITMSKNGNFYVLVKNKILKISKGIITGEINLDSKDSQNIKKLAVDSHENIFAIKDNNLVLEISKEKTITYLSFDKEQTFLSDIAIDCNDYIYLSDSAKNCIYTCSPKGKKDILSGKGYGFKKPMSITVDGYGRVYVLDIEQKKIFTISPKNKKVYTFADVSCVGGPYVIRSENNGSFIYLIGKDNEFLYIVSKFNVVKKIAYFSKWHMLTGGIALDAEDNIYLTTGGKSNRIVRILVPSSSAYGTTSYDLFFDTKYDSSCRDYFVAYKSEFYLPDGIVFDSEGNLYIADEGRGDVVKIHNKKNVEILATRKDGLISPEDIAVDRKGNIYVSDDVVSKVFCINKNDKKISVYADQESGLKEPAGLVFDKQDNLFIADEGRSAIIKITPDKESEIFADSSDGLVTPEDIIIDDYGFIYVADDSGKIFRFDPDGKGRILADESCGLKGPESLALDKYGNLFVSDEETSEIYEFKPTGEKRVYAKLATRTLRFLCGLAFSPQGELYVASAELWASRIIKIEPKRVTEESGVRKGQYQILKLLNTSDGLDRPVSFAWNKERDLFIADQGLGTVFLYRKNKLLPYIKIKDSIPKRIKIDKKDNLYIPDERTGNVYLVSTNKNIKILASRDNGLIRPQGLAIDDKNNIYIADEGANKIFKIKNGRIEIFMDSASGIDDPEEVVYSNGLLYIGNEGKGEILIVDTAGKIISKFHVPNAKGITFDKEGNIYVSSDGERKIYMVSKKGEKTVIADFYDGLRHPETITVDKEGNLIVGDETGCVFKIIPKMNLK